MPVILSSPSDPTDLVLQGEQMRQSTFDPANQGDISDVLGGKTITGFDSVLQEEDALPPMNSFVEINRAQLRRNKSGERHIRANGGIATPCGVWLSLEYGQAIIQSGLLWASNIFTISGQTVTGAGAALGNCRVVVYETGRMAVTATPPRKFWSAGNPNEAEWESPSPVVAEAISDGSGNFTITVPMNVAYQLTGYLTGSPDLAGITKNTVVPGTVNIYLRDPTTPDAAGSAVFRPVGSPVVRRVSL